MFPVAHGTWLANAVRDPVFAHLGWKSRPIAGLCALRCVRASNRVIDRSLSTDARMFRGDRCPVHAGPENQQRNEDGNRGKSKPDRRRRVDMAVAALVPDEQRNEQR
jgi:hypothetical protein